MVGAASKARALASFWISLMGLPIAQSLASRVKKMTERKGYCLGKKAG